MQNKWIEYELEKKEILARLYTTCKSIEEVQNKYEEEINNLIKKLKL